MRESDPCRLPSKSRVLIRLGVDGFGHFVFPRDTGKTTPQSRPSMSSSASHSSEVSSPSSKDHSSEDVASLCDVDSHCYRRCLHYTSSRSEPTPSTHDHHSSREVTTHPRAAACPEPVPHSHSQARCKCVHRRFTELFHKTIRLDAEIVARDVLNRHVSFAIFHRYDLVVYEMNNASV